MPHHSSEESRAELVRLLAGLDFFRDWRTSTLKQVRGPNAELDLNEIVEPGAAWLGRFDQMPEQGSDWIKEVKAWYSHTASELDYIRKIGSDTDRAERGRFLKDFRNAVGFDLLSEAGFLKSLAKKTLKRGKVANEDECAYLVEILNTTDQTILPPGDVSRLSRLVFEFGERR